MKKRKKILIVGGTGFLGYHSAKKFLDKKFDVISLSRNKPKPLRRLNKIKYLKVDISKKKKLFNILNKVSNIDYIINFGGEVEHKKKKKTFSSHFSGVKNLVLYFKKKNPRKFIQIGSSLEYGSNKSPQKEFYKLRPNSSYSRAKAFASSYLLNNFKKKFFPFVIVRPYQVFGTHQDLNRFIPIVITNCLKNKKFDCSDGKQLRDFLYIDDFTKFILEIIKSDKFTGEIFNVGSGKPRKIKNIINLIHSKIRKGSPQFGKIGLRKDENMITYPSIKKALKLTNWKPQTKFEIGIKKTIKFYEKYKT